MINYPELYRLLFNAITDAHDLIRDGHVIEGLYLLEKAQQQAEQQYIDSAGDND